MYKVKQRIHYWCPEIIKEHVAGQGVRVAVLDTGMTIHPDFKGRVLAFEDCVNHRLEIYDDSGHGTHVAGILAGDGRMSKGYYSGIAPEAELIIVKVLDEKGEGSIIQILEGLQWIRKNKERYQIRVVNLSVGAKIDLDETKAKELMGAVDRLWDIGIAVVVSAGNHGPGEGTIAIPGNSRKVITVGVMSEPFMKRNCSGIGPTKQCVVKPDLVAPGYQIVSCNYAYPKRKNAYTRKSGTSMATPVVAGAAALYFSKYPEAGNVELKLKLHDTCERQPNGIVQGWGCIRIDRILGEN
ncbi:MAG: S8 family peptidase [Lachnospiraceae bacterium]